MNPYYHPHPEDNPVLSPEESAHLVKVLRGKAGDKITILDGLGHRYLAEITDPNARKCGFKILSKEIAQHKLFRTHIAIAPTKSTDRLEWFVEKACELGVDEISIIYTQRTERKKVNIDRLEKKAISALKQSKNCWKCQIHEGVPFHAFIVAHSNTLYKYAAYVEADVDNLLQSFIQPKSEVLILIGPEGDFSPEEVETLEANLFHLVSLGGSVLRTETAGIVAAHTVHLVNQASAKRS